MKWLLQSLTGRMLLAVVGIHLLLVPLLFTHLLRLVESDFQAQFVDQVRSDAMWVASLVKGMGDGEALGRFLEELLLTGHRVRARVTDTQGRVLASAGGESGETVVTYDDLYFGQGGDDLYHISVPVYTEGDRQPSLLLHLAYDETPVLAEIQGIYRRGMALAAAYLLLALLAVVLFSNYLAASLRRLSQAAHRVASGALEEGFSFSGGPAEVQALAGDLERMRAELMARGQDLADRERRMRAIVDNIADAVVIFHPDGRIENCNPAARNLFGTDCAGLCGSNMRTLIRMRKGMLDPASLAGSGPQEVIGVRKDGSELVLELLLSRFRQGDETRFLAVLRDISERRRLEEERRRHRAELAHAGRLSSMGEMAAGLAHELNQPLAAVNMYIQGCLQRLRGSGCGREELLTALERAGTQAERAGEIIRRIRGFVRKEPPSRQSCDINDLILEAVDLVEIDLNRNEPALWLDLGDALPRVSVDPVQIKQVLINLVRNAIESLEDVPVEARAVVVRTHRLPGGEIQVEISDNGKGIPEDMLERVFDPFVTTRSEGMGLGLAISRSIIEDHGGRLWAEAGPQGGAVFRFVLYPEK